MQQLENSNQITTVAALHPATDIGTVTLKVSDLKRSLVFYTQLIGLQVFKQDDLSVVLGSGNRRILGLEEVVGAKPQPHGTTGLYHAAILWPDRRSLAIKIAQIASIRYPFGFSDHLVSEAFYLSDPDGNGLELYRDRSRTEWKWLDGKVQMANAPIDFDSFFAEIPEGDDSVSNPATPDGTKLGHMHLRVGDIPTAEKFYHGVLGFDIVARMPSALFVSAGGYHHHLGMNTWESLNGKAPTEPSAGLREFSISLPDRAELDRLTQQIEAANIAVEHGEDHAFVLDPWQNRIKFVLSDQLSVR